MESMRPWRQRLSLAGAAEAAWFLSLSLVLGALRAGYDPTHDAISRLGEQGSAAPLVWNLGGFAVAALLYALYSIAIRDAFGSGLLFVATVVQAVTIGGSGIFNCDTGCPPGPVSTFGALHAVFGLAYFAVTCAAPFIAWRTFGTRGDWRGARAATLAVGIVLVALFFAGPTLFGATWIGLWQRLVLIPALAWQGAVAVRIYRLAHRTKAISREPDTARHERVTG
jgi:hypothetical membrane protein